MDLKKRKYEPPIWTKIHFGPGWGWKKPDSAWCTVDVDPTLGDIIIDFKNFTKIPLPNNSIECVYGSHVFEHVSIYKSPLLFKEIYRVLNPEGILRLVIPDVERSIKEYINRNHNYKLFKQETARAKTKYNKDYTIFECLREDFISPTGQPHLLGKEALAHQNAWDYETICKDLQIAGFKKTNITKMEYQISQSKHFIFEGTYSSEANASYRSLYVEAIKK